jgi:hypothetical protein
MKPQPIALDLQDLALLLAASDGTCAGPSQLAEKAAGLMGAQGQTLTFISRVSRLTDLSLLQYQRLPTGLRLMTTRAGAQEAQRIMTLVGYMADVGSRTLPYLV